MRKATCTTKRPTKTFGGRASSDVFCRALLTQTFSDDALLFSSHPAARGPDLQSCMGHLGQQLLLASKLETLGLIRAPLSRVSGQVSKQQSHLIDIVHRQADWAATCSHGVCMQPSLGG